jgi:hypothetical protein
MQSMKRNSAIDQIKSRQPRIYAEKVQRAMRASEFSAAGWCARGRTNGPFERKSADTLACGVKSNVKNKLPRSAAENTRPDNTEALKFRQQMKIIFPTIDMVWYNSRSCAPHTKLLKTIEGCAWYDVEARARCSLGSRGKREKHLFSLPFDKTPRHYYFYTTIEAAAVMLVSIMDIKGGLLSWCKKFLIGRTQPVDFKRHTRSVELRRSLARSFARFPLPDHPGY